MHEQETVLWSNVNESLDLGVANISNMVVFEFFSIRHSDKEIRWPVDEANLKNKDHTLLSAPASFLSPPFCVSRSYCWDLFIDPTNISKPATVPSQAVILG